MTTLLDGTVVDESINAHNFTLAKDVPLTFRCGPRRVEAITIHHWGLPGQMHDAVVRYLASKNDRGSSAHAVISAGRATSIVHPDNAAWHAGNAMGQTITIGLELRPEASDADYVTAAAYIAFLRGIYGDLPLIPHNHWKPTACPGKWDLKRLDKMARSMAAPVKPGSTPPKPPVKPAPKPPAPAKPAADTRIHWVVQKGDSLSKISQYYYGNIASVKKIAAHNGIKNPNDIEVGQKIFIPGPLVWNIEAPDTIRSIAKYYGLDPAYLAKKNGLSGPDATIYIGNSLRID